MRDKPRFYDTTAMTIDSNVLQLRNLALDHLSKI